MTVSVHRLAGTAKENRRGHQIVWRTSSDAAETRARLESGIATRLGSWIDGDEFQIALSADPSSPALCGTIRSLPNGAEVAAVVSCRREVRDILRFGRVILFGFLALVAFALPLQAEGSALSTSLAGLALGCACVAACASLFEASMVHRLNARADVGELTMLMRRLLL